MRLGIFGKIFPGSDPDAVFESVAAHGLYSVQFNTVSAGLLPLPDDVPDEVLGAIRTASARHGVKLESLSTTFNMIHPDPAVREDGVMRLSALARAAQALEIPVLTLCTGTRDPENMWRAHPDNARPEAYRDLCTTLAAALEASEGTGVTLAFEPEQANVITTVSGSAQLLKDMGSPRLGVLLDLANLLTLETLPRQHEVLADALETLSERIVLAHAKDLTPDMRVVAPGQGVLDFAAYLGGLSEVGFGGALIMHGLTVDETPESTAQMRAALPSPT
jgi:sugar phosphate isomerase/epimerase